MNAIAFQKITIARTEPIGDTPVRVGEQRWMIAALLSMVLCVTCGLSGLGISAVSAFIPDPALTTLGTMLIVASFPLLILMAHCLDKTDTGRKAMR